MSESGEPAEPTNADDAQPFWTSGPGLLVLASVAFLIIMIAVAAFSGSEDEPDPELDRIAAEMACEREVRGLLKAPSTAEFVNTWAQTLGETRWRVTGSVDAENSFGGMLRVEWVCQAHATEPSGLIVATARLLE